MPANKDPIGSSLDELLTKDGTLEQVNRIAQGRVAAYQQEQRRDEDMAVHTSPPPKRSIG